MSYTSGPWITTSTVKRWKKHNNWAIVDRDGIVIAETFTIVGRATSPILDGDGNAIGEAVTNQYLYQPAETNARLLGAAAPLLLDPLDCCIVWLDMEDIPVVTETLVMIPVAIAND